MGWDYSTIKANILQPNKMGFTIFYDDFSTKPLNYVNQNGVSCDTPFCLYVLSFFLENVQVEEGVDLANQNEKHTQRNNELHADGEEGVYLALFAAVDFVQQGLGLDFPADHDAHEQSAQRHCDTFGEGIHEVKPAIVEFAYDAEGVLERHPHTVGAQTVQSNESGLHHNGDADPENYLVAVAFLALACRSIHKVSYNNFDKGDCGGDGCQQNKQIEHNAEEGANGAHSGENVLQSDEKELWSAQSCAGTIGCNSCGDNGDTGHESDDGIGNNDDNGVLNKAFLLAEVGAIGDHSTHCKGEGEEHLTAGSCQNIEEAGSLFNEARCNGIAGNKHKLETFNSAGKGERADDDNNQHHEQGGHTDLVELLDTAGNAAAVDEIADKHEEQGENKCAEGVGEHGNEKVGAGHNGAACEGQIAQVQSQILNAVCAQNAVKAHDNEGGENGQPANPLEAAAESLISTDGTHAGLATHGELAHHDNKTNKNSQEQVDNQKCKAAGSSHFIREAPNVAETNGGADGGHKEAYITSPGSSFFFQIFSLQ